MEDVQELKPSIFCGVPRVYDRIYTGIINKSGYVYIELYYYFVGLCCSKHLTLMFVLEGTINKISSGGALRKKLFDFAYN